MTRAELRDGVRRSWPVLVVLLAVALVLIRWTGSVAAAEWRDSLDEHLADAGAGTNAAMIETERAHLSALRAFSFTTGLPQALEALDIATVEELLGPVDANLGIAMVDVLDANGRVVFAFRGEGQVPPIYRDRVDLGIVQHALRGEPDEYGERFTTLVVTDEGAFVGSTGSVKIDDRVVGALLVMTPLADVLTLSSNQNGQLLTVYSGDGGVPLATTAPVKPRTLPSSLSRVAAPERLPLTSSYDIPGGETREQLGALVIRHETVAWLGVADTDRSRRVGGQVSLLTAVAVLLCSLLSALVAARWRTVPASRMPDGPDEGRGPAGVLPAPAKDGARIPTGAGRSRS